MRNLIIGFVVGITFVSLAWAAQGLTLVNGIGVEVGTTANPLYVSGV